MALTQQAACPLGVEPSHQVRLVQICGDRLEVWYAHLCAPTVSAFRELSVILTHGNLPPDEGQKTAQTSSKKGELWCPQGSRRPLRSIIVRNAEYSLWDQLSCSEPS